MAIVTAHVAAVQELYVAYFNRPADTGGLEYWTNVVAANNGDTTAVSASFAASPEYIVAYYGMNNTQIVNAIYSNMFGRGTGVADGREYWVNLLNEGRVSVNTIVAEVAKGAQGTDATAIENKVEAATAFTAAIDTPAEVAGYAGNSALTLAKAFITGVTTDATLTAAINPTALNATVAAVVKAGTPFSLESAVTASNAADQAVEDFLEDNDLEASTDVAGDLEGATDDAADDVAGFTYTYGTGPTAINVSLTGFATGSPAVQAALLADAEADLNTAVANSTTALAAARAAATAGVRAITDNLANANAALTEATTAAEEAVLVQNAAEASVEARAGGRTITITYNTAQVDDDNDASTAPVTVTTSDVDTVTIAGVNGGAAVTLIDENSAGTLRLASSAITETAYPGVTALLNALRANQDAQLDLEAATTAQADAQREFTGLGGPTTTNGAAAANIVAATEAHEAAETAVTDLADLVADWEEAVALETEYANLIDTQADAQAAFTANGFVAPEALTGTLAATSGSDVYVLGAASVTAATVTSFGRSGTDSIFLGTDFKLNEGALDDGDNQAMEIFFVQNGTRAEIHVEKAAYGSDSGDVTVITLVGVNADDLQFNNGVVTVANS